MQLNYRTKEEMKKSCDETKEWLDKSMNIPTQEIGEFFGARAIGYDKVMIPLCGDDYKTIPDFLPTSFKTLLDIGCGSGLELVEVFNKYPDIKVVGIDKCRKLLDALMQRECFAGKDIELIEADYFQYPFEENQYDVILSTESLHHFRYEKKKEIYSKIYKATKENGFYYEMDYMAQDEAFEKLNLDYQEKRRNKYNVPDDVFVHIDIPLTVEHQIELLKFVGFNKVEVLNKPFLKSNTVHLKATK